MSEGDRAVSLYLPPDGADVTVKPLRIRKRRTAKARWLLTGTALQKPA